MDIFNDSVRFFYITLIGIESKIDIVCERDSLWIVMFEKQQQMLNCQ